ncbi:MAG: 3-isopropylmalate dehydrogenase [Peptococcaceae bacterium]|nr:3-isopropylmalate dehydrogenase [Peptococcaceae bacterium]
MNEAYNNQGKIHWYDAFFEAIQLELREYKDSLIFEDEHQLSKEALIMDVLIIKKAKDVQIDKNIGRIFRTHNIFEYKSETDSLSISDYHKVLAYGLLYSSFEQVPLSDITISFAFTKHPRELVKYLKNERNLIIEDKNNGLYYIQGDIVPIQLIERKKLSKEDNLFLKNLGSQLSAEDILNTICVYRKQTPFIEKNAYLNRILEANKMTLKEAFKMRTTFEILWEAAEEAGRIVDFEKMVEARVEERFEERVEVRVEKQAKEIAKKLLLSGESIQKVSELTNLPLETVKALN